MAVKIDMCMPKDCTWCPIRNQDSNSCPFVQRISEKGRPSGCLIIKSANEHKPILDKIRAEIERQEKWLMDAGYNAYNVDIAFNAIKLVVDKYKAESEDKE